MINYNTLKEIQRNERWETGLTKIPTTFYEECTDYILQLEMECVNDFNVRRYKNTVSCYSEIIEKRLTKITTKTYYSAFRKNSPFSSQDNIWVDELPPNILPSEREVYNRISEAYDEFYGNILKWVQ